MSEFNKPDNQEAFFENFSQLKPLMNATMAYYESSRCLFCYDAPCVQACPTEIDIPLFIRQINTNNVSGAARTIYASNYFGNICGKVCPTEVLCEGACVFNLQDVKPIEIGRLQSFATTSAMDTELSIADKKPGNGKKIAVIGAGPAGLSCACELSNWGYEVDVFESRAIPSGLAMHGTAPYKITNEEVLEEVNFLQSEYGFTIHYNHSIQSADQFNQLEDDYQAIFLGIGLGITRSPGIEGEELDNCVGATEFIESLKINPFDTRVGKRVVVIGGGNTAMDAASESARMGSKEITLIYRRSTEKMPAYPFEYELAKSVGVKGIFNTRVVRIQGKGSVESISCIKTISKDGQVEDVPGSEFVMACDMVIKATGQSKQTGLLDIIGLEYDSRGRIKLDPETLQSSNVQYFAGGDAFNGGAEVVNACAEGKKAGIGIHNYLSKTNHHA